MKPLNIFILGKNRECQTKALVDSWQKHLQGTVEVLLYILLNFFLRHTFGNEKDIYILLKKKERHLSNFLTHFLANITEKYSTTPHMYRLEDAISLHTMIEKFISIQYPPVSLMR